MKYLRNLVVAGILIFLLSGCGVRKKINASISSASSNFWSAVTAVRTSPGKSRKISKKIEFYLAIGDDQYRKISDDISALFISDVKWFASDGVELQDPTITVSEATIVWEEGNTEYKVPGVRGCPLITS